MYPVYKIKSQEPAPQQLLAPHILVQHQHASPLFTQFTQIGEKSMPANEQRAVFFVSFFQIFFLMFTDGPLLIYMGQHLMHGA